MFGLENSANNFGASAGLLANTLANRPIQAALGTLFVGTNNLIVYRYNGVAWDTIGGGGGVFGGAINGLQTIGSNVGLGGSLTQNTDINCFNYDFKFEIFNSFAIGNGTEPTIIWNSSTETIITSFGGNNIGLNLDFNNEVYSLNVNAKGFKYYFASDEYFVGEDYYNGDGFGLLIQGFNRFILGDYGAKSAVTFLEIENSQQFIRTQNQNVEIGLKLDFANDTYSLGDFGAFGNGLYLQLDDASSELRLYGALLSGTASGFSGNHLSIYINGTHYKIKLENP